MRLKPRIKPKEKRKMNKGKAKGGLNRVGAVFVPGEPPLNQSFLPQRGGNNRRMK